MAAEPVSAEGGDEEELEPDEIVQLSIDGDGDLNLTIGGSKPNEATLSFGGGEIQLGSGQFKPGTRIAIVLIGVVDEAGVKHKVDPKTKQLTKVKRKHHMLYDTVRRIDVAQAEGPQLVQ